MARFRATRPRFGAAWRGVRHRLPASEVGDPPRRSRGAYDVNVKQINCVCGCVVKAEDDDELWKKAQEHLRADHPDLVGKVLREDILAQAEET
jgi:predicted small metal-binding protein